METFRMPEQKTPRKLPKRKEEIMAALRKEISALPSGARLPGNLELCRRFHCAGMTITRALAELELRGEVFTIGRKGTFVPCRELRDVYILVPAPGGRWASHEAIHDLILQEAKRRGIAAHLIYATTDNILYHVDRDSLERIPRGASVIVTSHWYYNVFPFLRERRCKVVYFDVYGDHLPMQMHADIIMTWQRLLIPVREAIGEAVHRLASKKHRRILFLHRCVHCDTIQISSFREALKRENISLDPAWEMYGTDYFQTLYENLYRRLHELPDCNAILTVNPLQAEAALAALTSLKRRVPRDVSLVCLRDHPRLLASVPPVSVVESFSDTAAANKALDMLASARTGPGTESLPFEVYDRGSI